MGRSSLWKRPLLWTTLYLGLNSLSAFQLLSTRQTSSGVHALFSTTPVPKPPWTFQASRIFYQFQAIPVDEARRFCPPCENSLLQLLSFGGSTLGGIFCVEYDDSPIGPYKEVAILSSLVARLPPTIWIPAIGAWASHIFVDSQDAADYGRDFWGLPATVVPIQFTSDSPERFQFSDQEIVVSGWKEPSGGSEISWLDHLTLPSFSGLLPMEQDNIESSSPLLQYPLSIVRPASIELASTKKITLVDKACQNPSMRQVQSLLEKSQPLVAASISNVGLVAGVPVVVE